MKSVKQELARSERRHADAAKNVVDLRKQLVAVDTDKATYQLTLTGRQARIVSHALELMFRIDMGQLTYVCEHLERKFADKDFKDMPSWQVRRAVAAPIRAVFFPELQHEGMFHGISNPETGEDSQTACDIHQVIRQRMALDRTEHDHKLREHGGVDFYSPMKRGLDPLPTIKRITEDKT